MPIYEYQCVSCLWKTEIVEKLLDRDLIDHFCERCKLPMKRLISVTNFELKGDCWAKDGYEKKNK